MKIYGPALRAGAFLLAATAMAPGTTAPAQPKLVPQHQRHAQVRRQGAEAHGRHRGFARRGRAAGQAGTFTTETGGTMEQFPFVSSE